jgi:putative heme-binding domain-containing protein
MLTAPETIEPLLKRLESGEISLQAIDSLKRRQLTSHRDESIRARAEKLFGAIQGNRAAVYASLKEVAELPGNSAHGRKVFGRSCANCHRLNQEGFAVGPDLFGIRNQPKATILLHLLVPDQEITQGFNAYTAVLHDGRSLQGLLANETATSVTLRLPQGKEENIPRDQLEEFSKSPLSLMPQGIENTLSRQELADLLAYLKGEAENEPPAIPPTEKAP